MQYTEEQLMREKERLLQTYGCKTIQEVLAILERQWASMCQENKDPKSGVL